MDANLKCPCSFSNNVQRVLLKLKLPLVPQAFHFLQPLFDVPHSDVQNSGESPDLLLSDSVLEQDSHFFKYIFCCDTTQSGERGMVFFHLEEFCRRALKNGAEGSVQLFLPLEILHEEICGVLSGRKQERNCDVSMTHLLSDKEGEQMRQNSSFTQQNMMLGTTL